MGLLFLYSFLNYTSERNSPEGLSVGIRIGLTVYGPVSSELKEGGFRFEAVDCAEWSSTNDSKWNARLLLDVAVRRDGSPLSIHESGIQAGLAVVIRHGETTIAVPVFRIDVAAVRTDLVVPAGKLAVMFDVAVATVADVRIFLERHSLVEVWYELLSVHLDSE